MTVSKEQIIRWLEKFATVLEENKHYLTELDSAIGDADHGNNMSRGFARVREKLSSAADQDIGSICKTTVSMTLFSSIGGASGPLYGTFFMRCGAAISNKQELDKEDLYKMFQAGVDGIVSLGHAKLGDKTMYDAWAPALKAMEQSLAAGEDVLALVRAAVTAAEQGMKETIPLQAKKGRASYLGERSIGHQDPGATSTFFLLNSLLETLEG